MALLEPLKAPVHKDMELVIKSVTLLAAEEVSLESIVTTIIYVSKSQEDYLLV